MTDLSLEPVDPPHVEVAVGANVGAVRTYPLGPGLTGRFSLGVGHGLSFSGSVAALPFTAPITDRLLWCTVTDTAACPFTTTFPSDEPRSAGSLDVRWTPLVGRASLADEVALGVRAHVGVGLGIVRRREYGVGYDTWLLPRSGVDSQRVEVQPAFTPSVGLDLDVGRVVLGFESRAWVWHDNPRRFVAPGVAEEATAGWVSSSLTLGWRWAVPARPERRARVGRPLPARPDFEILPLD